MNRRRPWSQRLARRLGQRFPHWGSFFCQPIGMLAVANLLLGIALATIGLKAATLVCLVASGGSCACHQRHISFKCVSHDSAKPRC
jgi:hypothetical protein